MDNRTIDITTEGGVDTIRTALSLVWRHPVTHWKVMRLRLERTYYCREPVSKNDKPDKSGRCHHHSADMVEDLQDGKPVLILLWNEEGGSQALPFPLDLDQSAAFIDGWLKSPAAEYGRQPDHDGDNEKAWRLFTEDWGHVAGYHYAVVGIQPAWAMYGK